MMLNWWQVIATSFFRKEMKLLSQTLTCVFKAVSFAICLSSPQVRTQIGLLYLACPSGSLGHIMPQLPLKLQL